MSKVSGSLVVTVIANVSGKFLFNVKITEAEINTKAKN